MRVKVAVLTLALSLPSFLWPPKPVRAATADFAATMSEPTLADHDNDVLPGRASPVLPDRHSSAGGRGVRKEALASISAVVVRLIRCGEQSCLQISGRRGDPAAIVRINGHAVPVEGEHSWRARLPVEVMREWSAPHARTIEVSLQDPETRRETVASADLPIGLLGGTTDLASLVISVR
jgi:hypothetical protein